jgi:hypothetical protein
MATRPYAFFLESLRRPFPTCLLPNTPVSKEDLGEDEPKDLLFLRWHREEPVNKGTESKDTPCPPVNNATMCVHPCRRQIHDRVCSVQSQLFLDN